MLILSKHFINQKKHFVDNKKKEGPDISAMDKMS